MRRATTTASPGWVDSGSPSNMPAISARSSPNPEPWENTPVWLTGTSRGTIYISNAASRLTGESAPDGLILPSHPAERAATSSGLRKPYFRSTWRIFGCPSSSSHIRRINASGHHLTAPERSPINSRQPGTDRHRDRRPQWSGGTSVKACQGKAPHVLSTRKRTSLTVYYGSAGGDY